MSKKAIGIIAVVVVAIIAIAIAIVGLKGNNKNKTLTDREMAKAISKIDSSKTEQEWIDIGKQELTDEQKQVAEPIRNRPEFYGSVSLSKAVCGQRAASLKSHPHDTSTAHTAQCVGCFMLERSVENQKIKP